MLSSVFLRSSIRSFKLAQPIVTRQFARPIQPLTKFALPASAVFCKRHYSSLPKDEVEKRIIEILKGFDKVTDPTKVCSHPRRQTCANVQITASSHFSNDLGLDSLDTVEVVMAIEEEFSIEIPDKDADEIRTVGDAIKYISEAPE